MVLLRQRRSTELPSRPDWSRSFPRPLVIPTVMRLKTLADVRKLMGHLPAATRAKSTWQHVAKCLDEAPTGRSRPGQCGPANGAEHGRRRVPAQIARPDKGQPEVVYEVIARRIIEAAKKGEWDPQRLRAAGTIGLQEG
jgi:hypothetical protein